MQRLITWRMTMLRRSIQAALAALLLTILSIAEADPVALFGPQPVTVPVAPFTFPVNGRAVPPRAQQLGSLTVYLSRENWPAEGVELGIMASFDGGSNYIYVSGPQIVPPFVPTPKQPDVSQSPAFLSFAWGPGSPRQNPTHVKIVGDNLGAASFQATAQIDYDNLR
jgi:hypothetical protein